MKKATFLLLIFFAFSCASPQKSFEKRQYDKAFASALAELQRGRSIADNERVLKLSLDKIVEREFAEATRLIQMDKVKYGDKVIRIYKRLRKKIENTSPYLGLAYQAQIDTLDSHNDELMKGLFDIYYESAQEHLEAAIDTKRKVHAQNAYYDFQKAREYGYQNEVDLVAPLQEEALELGIIYYYVEADVPFDLMAERDVDREFRDIENEGSVFQHINFEGSRDDIDCALEIDFNSLNFDIKERSDSEYFKKEVENGYENVTDTSGNVTQVPIYIKVEALVKIITKTKTASWDVDVDVSHYTDDCDLSGARFSAKVSSEIEVTEWEGDERAVPSRYKSAFDGKFDDEDEMTERLIEDLYQQVVNYYFQ